MLPGETFPAVLSGQTYDGWTARTTYSVDFC